MTQPIWKKSISIASLQALHRATAIDALGIEFTEVGPDFICARIAVDKRTRQPFGLLHGGVSVVLAETLGSCGANHACDQGFYAVGLDINANHLKGATQGWVTGKTWPQHIGRSTQVWAIELRNEAGDLTCVSRLTMSVLAERRAT
jgi:1,4-dihydroxy-2-naphthoyl-CoA hydrolase